MNESTERRAWTFSLLLSCSFVLALHAQLPRRDAPVTAPNAVRVSLGDAVVPLNGPWKFHTGDDPRWAQSDFDDSSWESVDLTPLPGAHDSDVGLTGYVPGWQAKAHPGYSGYAWYRLRVAVDVPQGESLALVGPLYVDYTYQLFVDGRLMGGAGDFSTRPPTAYNAHQPRLFLLPKTIDGATSGADSSVLVAIRVWMAPWSLGTPEAGGIHIAPAVGSVQGAQSLYRQQWTQTIKGYAVDAAEGVLFLILAVMVCTLIPFDRSNHAYRWLAAALILTAFARGNQAVFFWWHFESVQAFELATGVLFVPLSLAAWILAWRSWFPLRELAWMPRVVGGLSLLYVIPTFLRRSWFYGVFPHWFGAVTLYLILSVRWVFALLMLLIIVRSMRQRGSERWFALPAILLISVGLFARELTTLHVPGIWFPFGVGVSLTEYAYAAFDVALYALLLHRLYALRQQPLLVTEVVAS